MNEESTLVRKEQNHLQADNMGSALGPEDWAMFPAREMPGVTLKEPPALDIPSLVCLSSVALELALQFCVLSLDNLVTASGTLQRHSLFHDRALHSF